MDVISQQANWFVSPIDSSFPAHRSMDRTARFVSELFNSASTHRTAYDRYWNSFYNSFRSRQWPERLPLLRSSKWRARLTINYTFAIIESINATLFDGRPKINVAARSVAQHPYVDTLQAAIDSVWERRGCEQKLAEAGKNSEIYGTGYLKVWWDPTLENGLGDIQVSVVPTEYIYVDPSATSFEDAEYVLEVKPVPISYIRRHYPKMAKFIRPDAPTQQSFGEKKNNAGSGMGSTQSPYMPFRFMSPVGDNPLVADQTEFSNAPYRPAGLQQSYVQLIECWVKDYSYKEKLVPLIETIMDPFTGMPIQITRIHRMSVPAYPFGRVIHVANGITLEDKKSPYRRWPYVRMVDMALPAEFYGVGEPEILFDLQNELNKRRSQMIDHASLTGNTIWIVDRNSGVDQDMITNRPGLIIWKHASSEVRRDEPPQMPNWMPEMVDRTIMDMREISGVSAIPGGTPPRGVRSGAGFEAAQGIASTRIRHRGKNVERAISDMGRIFISHIQQFYTVPRMIRIIGDIGQVNFMPFDGRSIRGDWDISVESASTVEQTQAARAQQAIQLFQMGAIDARALLEAVRFHGYEQVLRRLGDMSIMPNQFYPGFPGMPNKDRTDQSGYSFSTRQSPTVVQMPAGPGMQGPPMPRMSPGSPQPPNGPQGQRQ